MELVVGASNATMRSLLGKLGGLLAQEYALVRGVRRDVQYINDELTSMQAFLRDLSTAPDGHDNRMKDWMKQIRDMGYDIEDCIDDFAHRIPRDPSSDVKCLFIRTRFYELRMWWPRREIASKIADLKVRAQQIGERRSRYGVDNPSNHSNNNSRVRAATYEIAEHQLVGRQLIGMKEPVGMTDDMNMLENWLAKSDKDTYEERVVLSIVGFGGVGKTTIAMALYQKVRDKFDYRASVTVSQNYDQDAVLMMILKQVKPQENDHKKQGNSRSSDVKQIKIEALNHDELVKELKNHLAEKRYLLFIDDIWSAKTWETIRNCLPDDNRKCSRVIVTTRFQAVGATCSQSKIDFLHSVDFLSDEESKKLFEQSVSESKSSKDSGKELDQVSDEICKICRGLPLAIVTISGESNRTLEGRLKT